MGFSLFEIASWLGRPVCLYEFAWGETVYRYTSADRDIEWGLADDGVTPLVWSKLAIKDSGFTQGSGPQDFTVSLPRNNPIVELFRLTPPSSPITLVCRRFHRDDPDNEATVYWTGTVANVRARSSIESEILGMSIGQTLKRAGIRKCWEIGCTNVLYDEDCRANKENFRVDTTITALTGTTITVASFGAFPAARFAGGYVEWEATAEGTLDRRSIESAAEGMTLNLFGTSDRLTVGQAITLYCGCDLTAETCDDFFNNLPNYGGHVYMTRKSPFDGTPVF